jgi:hypothetical protein
VLDRASARGGLRLDTGGAVALPAAPRATPASVQRLAARK